MRSLIDHFLISEDVKQHVAKYYTVNNIDNNSDHAGIMLSIDLGLVIGMSTERKFTPRVAWYKATF